MSQYEFTRPPSLSSLADTGRPPASLLSIDGVVGSSSALAHSLSEAAIAARHDITLLITGEPGTGKTMLARTIHRSSPRADGPFVEVSCPNLPPALLENELFGRERGAYTDAATREVGKVAAAEGGTLFLDEIGEFAMDAQAKLLMLLNDKLYYPLGSRTAKRADVRIITATNQMLGTAICGGSFRRDLYDRMSEMTIEMPSLRERLQDIPALAVHLTDEACKCYRLPTMELTPVTLSALRTRPWPGNLRELRNHLRMAVLRADADGTRFIGPHHVFPDRLHREGDPAPLPTLAAVALDAQRVFLSDSLRETQWNVAAAARRIRASRSHVNHLISQFGLQRPATERSPKAPSLG